MEELQNAIQGAIAHCKNSMLQQNSNSFNNNGNNKGKAAIEIVWYDDDDMKLIRKLVLINPGN